MDEQERRQQIMRAAEELFTSRRFHEVTTEEIASAAGIGKGTIYRYFRDKEDLFHQTAMHGFEELCEFLEGASTGTGGVGDSSLEARLSRACGRIDLFFKQRRKLFGMMQAEENRLAFKRGRLREQWRERRRRLTGILGVLLQEAADAGDLRADIPAERQAGILLGMLKSAAYGGGGGEAERDAIVAELVDVFLNGARKQG